eukprot:s4667_g1.t1
MIVDE